MRVSENNRVAARGVQASPSPGWVLASLSLSALLPALGTSIAQVALPTLTEAFSASFQQVQWVVLAYLLAITTLIVSVGRLGDLVGRRRLLMAGIASGDTVAYAASALFGLQAMFNFGCCGAACTTGSDAAGPGDGAAIVHEEVKG